MKSIEEQTMEAAENHYTEWNKYPSNGVKEDCMDDFIAGAEWERNRDKWISVKDEKPSKRDEFDNDSVPVLVTDGENIGLAYYSHSCAYWFPYPGTAIYKVKSWQPIPELPKKKGKQ